MAHIHSGRKTVDSSRDLVVFLIGARVNKWWLLPLSLPILAKMRRMQAELMADPESGLLGYQEFGSGQVQYWRSIDDLVLYAENKKLTHQPAAKNFFRKIFKNEAVGIWHETYVVPAGNYECIYTNMPSYGLGKTTPLIDARNELSTARGRLAAHQQRRVVA